VTNTPETLTLAPTAVLPVLPIKNTVLFPYLFLPLAAGRPASIAAVETAALSEEKTLVVVAQRDASVEQPTASDLYTVGTKAVIKRLVRSNNTIELLVQGIERVSIIDMEKTEPYLAARVRPLPLPDDTGPEVEALHRSVLELAGKMMEIAQPENPITIGQLAAQAPDPLVLAFLLASMVGLDVVKEQQMLETTSRAEGLRLLYESLTHELQVLQLRQKIASKAQGEMSREQKQYLLRQQLRAINEELGESDPDKSEVDDLRKRLEEANLPEEAHKEALRELGRLERISPASPERQLTRSWLEFVLDLPWRKSSEETIDLDRTAEVLNEDHYGLEKVKERILEHLAVLKLNPGAKAPILCFVGPPGVGKTSLGQSIARALGRKFERMSLGGMHDEAELRGHRRTYIGAMPGRILQALRRAGVNNPVLLLDEVDKIGHDFRGDPAFALLEVLDPAQNNTFRDNYLDLPFDLSRVLFLTTANGLETIPRPLLDRMELLSLGGYSEEEKIQIAERYLVPRQLTQAGLKPEQLTIPQETIRRIISRYTREAGVRELERMLGQLARKVARRFASGETQPVTIGPEDVSDQLGPERFFLEQARQELPAGVSTGLAWTETGGDVLYIEAAHLPGSRRLRLTGQLGDVMRESARIAQSYVWAHAEHLGIEPAAFRDKGLHIHVPAGAIPKDGPSAGVALVTALASLYTGVPVRSGTAMTGEVTLTGLVLPVGGIKEKVLAARRAGVRRVILPRQNQKDLRELPEPVRKEMEFILAERVEDVLAAALPELEGRMAAQEHS
jgi:ATP-dependent Lon protease